MAKPDNVPLCINILSNYPPNIINYLSNNISKRINNFLADDLCKIYTTMHFLQQNGKRKIIWFNPIYSANVLTNIV